MSKNKITVRAFLVLAIILSLTGVAIAQPSDIQGHWAEKHISDWVAKDLVKGYLDGTFKPDNSITRAEFITLINRAFGYTQKGLVHFSDVSTNDWFYDEIAKAKAIGYLTGYPDGTIKPNNNISREEVASIITRILKLNTSSGTEGKFLDSGKISQWSVSAIEAVVNNGYMAGYPDNSFHPTDSITRAETVIVFDRAVGTLFNTAGLQGPASGTNTIDGNATINTPGVTLQNTIISGNLYLTEGIGDGEVKLKNVTVKGTTLVRGGGAHSLVLEDCTIPSITVSKEGVRVVASGNTAVRVIRLESGANLVEVISTGPGFETVTVSEVVPANAFVTLQGSFDTVKVAAAEVKVDVAAGTVAKLYVAKEAAGATLNIAKDASVTTLTLDSAVKVTGQGTIEKAEVNVNGSSIEQTPQSVAIVNGTTVTVGNKEVTQTTTNTTTSSSGGGGGGGQSSSNHAPVAKTVADQSVTVGGASLTLTGADLATDSDSNDTLSVTSAAYGTPGKVDLSVTGGNLVISPVSEGATAVDATVQDSHSAGVNVTFNVTVKAKPAVNHPPAAKPVADQSLSVDGSPLTLTGSQLATDPDGDALTVTEATYGTAGVVSLNWSSGSLVISPVAAGTTSVTATVYDTVNQRIDVTFSVTVSALNDATPPAASVTTATVKVGSPVATAQSTEIGTVYLVLDSAAITTKDQAEAAVTGGTAQKATVSSANTNTSITTTGLEPGTYKVMSADAAGNLSVKSTGTITIQITDAFSNGGSIPTKYAYTGIEGGQNISIPLSWNKPVGTLSFAIIMFDDAAGGPSGFPHWKVVLPATVTTLAEGANSDTYLGCGANQIVTYYGPEPLGDPAPHTYHIKVYALNVEANSITDNTTFMNTISDASKIISSQEVTGTFTWVASTATAVTTKETHYTVTSDVSQLDKAHNTIVANNTPITTVVQVQDFIGNLNNPWTWARWKVFTSVNEPANADLFNNNPSKANTDTLATGDVLAVLAEDGTTLRIYAITVTSALNNPISDFASSSHDSTSATFTWTAPTGATAVVINQTTTNPYTVPEGSSIAWGQSTIQGGTLAANASTATVIGLNPGKTYWFYLYVTSGPNSGESNIASLTTSILNISQIVVHNNAGLQDYVEVNSLAEGDTVKVYDSAVDGNLLGSQTIAQGETNANISIAQLGSAAGSVFVTITRPPNTESARIEKTFDAEFSPPSNVSASTSLNDGKAENTIKWNDSVSLNVTTYYIYRVDVNTGVGEFISSGIDKNTQTYTDTTAVPGTTYIYYVYACDGNQTFAISSPSPQIT